MEHYLFKQLQFVRENTLSQVAGMKEAESRFIPKGFNNNVKWNLGHVYVVNEKFCFELAGGEAHLHNEFVTLFGTGTMPTEWGNQELPTIDELIQLLSNQLNRTEQYLEGRLDDEIQPYTTSTGLTLSTVKELISFCLYHEGMHFDAIKSINRMIQNK
ncbi:DinB family protein [Bacillus sp. JCM 19034]|uniref:DinB family protein n=1 Tax=Bacillus sp. JCM 19034 TaxID=1481928 RepID=UPI0007862221|nr:DinB family protein [Bacillus sp. JCM 19034]